MANQRRFFISDVHLGGDRAWWRSKSHEQNLIACLDWIGQEAITYKNVKDVVFLGDLFDTWMFPMDTPPMQVSEIAAKHPNVVQAVNRCSSILTPLNGNVFYTNGNHDMHVSQADLDHAFGPGMVRRIPVYHGGLLYAEHGSRFAMFNAPDFLHDPHRGLPVGYFVTRMLASTDNQFDSPKAIFGYVNNALKAIFTAEKISECLVDAIMELAKKRPDDTFKMPDGGRDLTVAEVRVRYASLFSKWNHKFGPEYCVNAVRADLGSLGWFGDRLCEKEGYRVVVLGHTHDEELDKDSLFVKGARGYANSGFWCCAQPSLVEVEKGDKGYVVRLHDWSGGSRVKTQDMRIPI